MKNVEKFNSPLFGELRCIQNEEGAPLFCLADVCASLELRVNDVIKRTGCAHEIIGVSKEVVSHGKGTGKFKEEGMYFVTEPDLYRCIFQSRKSSARSFQDWVFAEVIPALRKDGAYVVANQQDDDETLMAKALIAANRAIKRNEERVRQLEAQSKVMKFLVGEGLDDTMEGEAIAEGLGSAIRAFDGILPTEVYDEAISEEVAI